MQVRNWRLRYLIVHPSENCGLGEIGYGFLTNLSRCDAMRVMAEGIDWQDFYVAWIEEE